MINDYGRALDFAVGPSATTSDSEVTTAIYNVTNTIVFVDGQENASLSSRLDFYATRVSFKAYSSSSSCGDGDSFALLSFESQISWTMIVLGYKSFS